MPIKLTDEEFEQSKTKEGLEALLTKVCGLAVEDALRVLPSVVQSLALQISSLKEYSTKFYEANPDLANNKNAVALLLEEIESKNPGRKPEALLKDLEVEARRRLTLSGTIDVVGSPKPMQEELDKLASMFEEAK